MVGGSSMRGGAEALARLVPASSCRVPRRRSGIVEREGVVKALIDAGAELIVIAAPAGYGKTTTALLWAEADHRPFAWVQLGRADTDTQHLLRHVAAALATIGPLPTGAVDIIAGPGRSLDHELTPALQTVIEAMAPFVLVLDDAHVLQTPLATACVETLVDALPCGATIALVGRSVAAFEVARRRVDGQLFELDSADLAMSEDEARQLYDQAGHDLDDRVTAALVQRTEGWPAVLHLAGLSLTSNGDLGPGKTPSGRDRFVADYFAEEVLNGLPERTVSFLERSAVLDFMSAALLNEVLDGSDAGEQLHELERSGNMLLVPLDNDRDWYRYHQLFGEFLRARLERRDPQEAARLKRKTSLRMEAAGDIDAAIYLALDAGDAQRAADLVLSHSAPAVLNGRTALLGRWLDALGPTAADVDPIAAMCWGWFGFGSGDAAMIQRSIAAARAHDSSEDRSQPVLPGCALFGALLGEGGIAGTIEAASMVLVADAIDPIWKSLASALRGIALAISGETAAARADFLEALPAIVDLPAFDSGTRAHLALLDLYDGDLEGAERLIREALQIARAERLEGLPVISITFAAGALVLARCGHPTEARTSLATATVLLDRLAGQPTRPVLINNVVLACAALTLDDRPLARTHIHNATRAREAEPDAHRLNELLEIAADASAPGRAIPGRPALTPAEMRVLRLLSTHLGLKEIARELSVSRNTVKTHAMGIYRKLGVSSRSEAVDVARSLGLLDRSVR